MNCTKQYNLLCLHLRTSEITTDYLFKDAERIVFMISEEDADSTLKKFPVFADIIYSGNGGESYEYYGRPFGIWSTAKRFDSQNVK